MCSGEEAVCPGSLCSEGTVAGPTAREGRGAGDTDIVSGPVPADAFVPLSSITG